jgi:hypothetical protein
MNKSFQGEGSRIYTIDTAQITVKQHSYILVNNLIHPIKSVLPDKKRKEGGSDYYDKQLGRYI